MFCLRKQNTVALAASGDKIDKSANLFARPWTGQCEKEKMFSVHR